jgi:hypothetical protein
VPDAVPEGLPEGVPDEVVAAELVATEVAQPASYFTSPIFSTVKVQELKLLSSVSNDLVSSFVLKLKSYFDNTSITRGRLPCFVLLH